MKILLLLAGRLIILLNFLIVPIYAMTQTQVNVKTAEEASPADFTLQSNAQDVQIMPEISAIHRVKQNGLGHPFPIQALAGEMKMLVDISVAKDALTRFQLDENEKEEL